MRQRRFLLGLKTSALTLCLAAAVPFSVNAATVVKPDGSGIDETKMTEEEKEALHFIVDAGVYGSRDFAVQRRLSDSGYGKLRYALERFIEPLNKNSWNYRNLSYEFPFFYRHRIFLPLLPFYRVILRLASGRLKAELKALKKAEKNAAHDSEDHV